MYNIYTLVYNNIYNLMSEQFKNWIIDDIFNRVKIYSSIIWIRRCKRKIIINLLDSCCNYWLNAIYCGQFIVGKFLTYWQINIIFCNNNFSFKLLQWILFFFFLFYILSLYYSLLYIFLIEFYFQLLIFVNEVRIALRYLQLPHLKVGVDIDFVVNSEQAR